MVKAIALMSGGLDSTLAASLIKNQGVCVIGLHLTSPFGCYTHVEKSAKAVGVELLVREKGEAYLELVRNPKYGYGKNMNPCIDCRIYMFVMAEKVMREVGASFVVTGEVVGQRPMSQRREAIDKIDSESGLDGLVVRPLSAKFFKPTVAESNGWIHRDELLSISGRSRTSQLELAKQWGIKEFEAPGGGCLLTDMNFSTKLKDLFSHSDEKLNEKEVAVLRWGRHFRIGPRKKVILGRNKEENEKLKELSLGGTYFEPMEFLGPSALTYSKTEGDENKMIGELILKYSKVSSGPFKIKSQFEKEEQVFEVFNALSEEKFEELKI